MKALTIGLGVLCVIIGSISIYLWQTVRQQRWLIDADVQSRVCIAQLQRGALDSLLAENRPQSFTNLAYLLYMDTCLADVAADALFTERQKEVMTEEARAARLLFDHPALTNYAAFMNGLVPIRRTLWPKSTGEGQKQNDHQQGGDH